MAGKTRQARRCAAIIGFVVALAACGGSGGGQATPSTPPSSSSGTTTSSAVVLDEGAVKQLTVQLADLGPGWTQVRDDTIPTETLNPASGCSPSGIPAPGRRSAGAIAEYSLNLQSGLEQGHVVSTVLIQATVDDATQTQQRLSNPAYLSCFQQDAADTILQATGAPPGTVHNEPLSMPTSVTGVAARITLTYTFQGADKVGYADYFDFVVGRVESRVSFTKCCSPIDDNIETSVVAALHDRAASSPVGS
jgi:hypothetical protein